MRYLRFSEAMIGAELLMISLMVVPKNKLAAYFSFGRLRKSLPSAVNERHFDRRDMSSHYRAS